MVDLTHRVEARVVKTKPDGTRVKIRFGSGAYAWRNREQVRPLFDRSMERR